MATGFMAKNDGRKAGHCIALLLVLGSGAAGAADVALVGLMSDRAMVVIDGGKRQTLTLGGALAGLFHLGRDSRHAGELARNAAGGG